MATKKQKLYLPKEGVMAIMDAMISSGIEASFPQVRLFCRRLQDWDMLIIGKNSPSLEIVDDWGADLEIDMIDAAIGKIELKKAG